MHERDQEASQAAPAVPDRPLAVAQQPAGILRLQSTIGNRATARLIAREDWETKVDAPKSAILLSYDQIEATYVAHYRLKARTFGATAKNDPRVMAAAGAATRTQVGSLNYDRWLQQRGGGLFLMGVEIGPIEYKDDATQAAENAKADWSPAGRARDYEALNARAQQLTKRVAAVEQFVHKLKTPEGAKGVAYQYGQAGFAAMYGVGARSLGFARDKVNPMQQGAEMGWTLVLNKETGAWEKVKSATYDKQVKDFKAYSDEMGNTIGTSYDIAAGNFHQLYLQTRPSYNSFMSAVDTFYSRETGTGAYLSGVGMMEELTALGVMHGAMAQMEASAAEYANIVQVLGLAEKAANIDKMSKGIEGGMVNSVEIAVDMLAGALIGGSVSPLGTGFGKLKLDGGIPGKGVIEPLLEVGKAGAKEATK